METFRGLWVESTNLWVTETLKGIYRNKNRGALNLLLMLSHQKYFRAFSYLMLYCRGDLNDPLLKFLMYLTTLCRPKKPKTAESSYRNEKHKNDRKEVEETKFGTVCVLMRFFFAALTPILVHIYITRCKTNFDVLHPCHIFSAIIFDFYHFLNAEDAKIAEDFVHKLKLRRYAVSPKSSVQTAIKTPIQRSIMSGVPPICLINCVDIEKSETENKIVGKVLANKSFQKNPVDNISGLQQLLSAISNLVEVKDRQEFVPASLFQCYEMIPESHKLLKTQVESAIVYIQRMRSLDLEHRKSRKKLLKDAFKDYQKLKKSYEDDAENSVPVSRMWCNFPRETIKGRKASRTDESIKSSKKLGGNNNHKFYVGPLKVHYNDNDINLLVLRSFLFFGEYFSGFSKICDVLHHLGMGKKRVQNSRSLVVAMTAILQFNKHFSRNSIYKRCYIPCLKTPLLVYHNFIGVFGAIAGMVFEPVLPHNISPRESQVVKLISLQVTNNLDKGALYFSSSEKDMDCIRRNFSELLSLDEVVNVANRIPLLNAFSEVTCCRIFMSESLALCMLKVHASVYTFLFADLRECFRNMDQGFRKMATHSPEIQHSESKLYKAILEVMHAKRPLVSDDDYCVYSKFIYEYFLYLITQIVIAKLQKRLSHEMLPKAYWLAISHMKILEYNPEV